MAQQKEVSAPMSAGDGPGSAPGRLDRVRALQRERTAVLKFCRTLTDDDWKTPSDCSGWTVKDVVSHMGAAFHGCFNPSWLLRLMRTADVERSNDHDVDARRGWSGARVLDEYELWSGRFLALAPLTQRPPLRRLRLPIGELGRYPVALLASAFVFDHHIHLRHDIASALGRRVPPPDGERVSAVVEWLLAGLPQMCRTALAWIDRPLTLTLTGPGGGRWTIAPGAGGLLTVGAPSPGAATITGSVETFPVWATRRRPWRDDGLSLAGDEQLATRFLDSLNLV